MLSLIIQKINGLNSPIKRYRFGLKKQGQTSAYKKHTSLAKINID
jgi:hypothetical protein